LTSESGRSKTEWRPLSPVKCKRRVLLLKKYSVGNYEAGSNLSEEDFHYLWEMRKVCSRVEKMSEFIDEFILKESIYGINASRNVVI
jgi:hypothetical protein